MSGNVRFCPRAARSLGPWWDAVYARRSRRAESPNKSLTPSVPAKDHSGRALQSGVLAPPLVGGSRGGVSRGAGQGGPRPAAAYRNRSAGGLSGGSKAGNHGVCPYSWAAAVRVWRSRGTQLGNGSRETRCSRRVPKVHRISEAHRFERARAEWLLGRAGRAGRRAALTSAGFTNVRAPGRDGEPTLREDVLHHIPVHVRQAHVAAAEAVR